MFFITFYFFAINLYICLNFILCRFIYGMDTIGNDEFVSNFNYAKLSYCCEKYCKQNLNLEKALEKEKKKRKKVENAFRQLLIAYNSIVDAKKFLMV